MLDREKAPEAEVINMMHAFNLKNSGMSYSYVVRGEDGAIEFVEMVHRPCYGELRRYHPSRSSIKCNPGFGGSVNCTRPDDRWPGDLPRPMKEGLREAIGLALYCNLSQDIEKHNRLYRFLMSDQSPWRKGLRPDSIEFTEGSDGRIKGMVMTETDVDPTVMVNLFQKMRSMSADRWVEYLDQGLSEIEALLALFCINKTIDWRDKSKVYVNVGITDTYTFTANLDVGAFVNGTPRDLSSGKTWRDGDDYNRPEIQDLFMVVGGDGPTFNTRLQEYIKGTSGEETVAKAIEFIRAEIAPHVSAEKVAA